MMSKSVMLSIQPKWCELIASGKKTIDVRKTKPNIARPFKCYIYCTKGKSINDLVWNEEKVNQQLIDNDYTTPIEYFNGKVIGEFVCNKIDTFYNNSTEALEKGSCLTNAEIVKYSNPTNIATRYRLCSIIYGWRISNLKIYDKPKELREFKTPPCEKPENACSDCKYRVVINTPMAYESECWGEDGITLTRPPQSWCYVEEL